MTIIEVRFKINRENLVTLGLYAPPEGRNEEANRQTIIINKHKK